MAFRNLDNYIKQHPKAKGARNLTQARRAAFGEKRSLHGVDKAISHMLDGTKDKAEARMFWGGKGYDV